ncbi:MAG TPA: formate dehydrogenase accessory protein FdhE [Syntrophales bacterium]|nr:formate dehydrogenase accessory protein FdhE [Syntrophales bacterium]
MNDRDAALERLDANLREAEEKNPHSRGILEAFGPLMIEQRRLIGNLDWRRIDPSGIDGNKLKAGVPVIRQIRLFFQQDPWQNVLLPLIDAARRGFPQLREGLDAWEACVGSGTVPFHDYFHSYPPPDETLPASWDCVRDIPAAVSRLLLAAAARTVLELRSAEAAPVLRDAEWDKGYCPFCGSFAGIARVHDKITQRWLHCLHCGWDWRFNRVRCPYCEHESPQEMNYFFLEGKTVESAFTCEECKRYLVTLYRASDIGDPDLDVTALSLIHLDLIMQQKGYQPLDPSGWLCIE